MYVFGLIMTSFPTDRVCRLSYSLRTIQLTPSENTHALQNHVEFYVSTTSSSSVETSFKSFKLDHNFHFEISVTFVLPLHSGSPIQIFIFQKPSMLRTLCIQNPASYQHEQCVCEKPIFFARRGLPSNLLAESVSRESRFGFQATAGATIQSVSKSISMSSVKVVIQEAYHRDQALSTFENERIF